MFRRIGVNEIRSEIMTEENEIDIFVHPKIYMYILSFLAIIIM